MGKETQKAKIERLEKELDDYREILRKQDKQLYSMGCIANESFEKAPKYREMKRTIEELEVFNRSLKRMVEDEERRVKELRNALYSKVKEIEGLKEQIENGNISPNIKNSRGAGRKAKFSEQDKETIKLYRLQGKTIKEIAEMYECSVGLIHKLINE
ncbi:MAG: Hin recombinase [Clostridium sp.]